MVPLGLISPFIITLNSRWTGADLTPLSSFLLKHTHISHDYYNNVYLALLS